MISRTGAWYRWMWKYAGSRKTRIYRPRRIPEIPSSDNGNGTGSRSGGSLCVKKGISPRKLEEDVSELQKILKEQGAIIDGTH